ncbi:hypothetical protein GC170_08520 [bacterium]|nr:hypothetical protein [bacterium]
MPKHADPRRAGLPRLRETKPTESATDFAQNAIVTEVPEIPPTFEVISNPPQESSEQIDASADLQNAQANQASLESAHARLVEEEMATAAERFARLTRDRFVADRSAWLADPALNLPIFAATFEGAKYLASLWDDLAAALAPDAPGPTFDQARQAAAALGSRWQVAQVRGDGAWIMARYVRSSADPESVITRWVKESTTPDDTRERAVWHLRHTPEGIDARAELARRAAAERDRWKAEAARLQARADASRRAMVETSVGTGSADPALEKRFRLLNRLLTQARSRTDKLQRRLDTLKKQRVAKASKGGKEQATDMRLKRESKDRAEISAREQCADSNPAFPQVTPPAQFETRSETKPDLAKGPHVEDCSNANSVRTETDSSSLKDASVAEMQPEIDEERRQRLIKGLSRFRRMDWSDPKAIAPEDVEVITNLRNLPDSLQRDSIVRLTFGTEKALGKAWRQYLIWRDESEPMGVAPASFEE